MKKNAGHAQRHHRIIVKRGFLEKAGRHAKVMCTAVGARSPALAEGGEGLSRFTTREVIGGEAR